MFLKKSLALFLFIFSLSFVSGCGGSSTPSVVEGDAPANDYFEPDPSDFSE